MKLKTVLVIFIFLFLNFGALAIGGYFTGLGVPSNWYLQLNKAPWTPPGWVFGFSWTTIMICYSIYMALLWQSEINKQKLFVLYIMQWILNVGWNPVFFYFHEVVFGMIIIVLLMLLIGYFLLAYQQRNKLKSLLILPYFIWLLLANSLNLYIVIHN